MLATAISLPDTLDGFPGARCRKSATSRKLALLRMPPRTFASETDSVSILAAKTSGGAVLTLTGVTRGNKMKNSFSMANACGLQPGTANKTSTCLKGIGCPALSVEAPDFPGQAAAIAAVVAFA